MADKTTKKRRPWYITLAWIAAPVALLVGLPLIILDLVGRAALQREIDVVRAAGDPLTFEELEAARPVLADDENSALILEALNDRLKALGDALGKDALLPLLGNGKLPAPGDPYPQEMLTAIRTAVNESTNLLEELAPISELSQGRLPVVYTTWFSTPLLRSTRMAVKIVALDAIDQSSRGELEIALDRTALILSIAGSSADEPSLISVLVTIASEALAVQSIERVLTAGAVKEQSLALLGQRIQNALDTRSIAHAFRAERVSGVAMIRHVAAGGNMAVFGGTGPSVFAEVFKYVRGWRYLEEAKAMSLMTPLCEPGLACQELIARANQYQRNVQALSSRHYLLKIVLPALSAVTFQYAMRTAMLRSALVALAVERYRLRHGDWPAELALLVPEFLDELPVDPFDGQPLRYLRNDRGVTIYSFGQDVEDDQGDVCVETGSKGRPQDVGFRLLNPELRGFRIADEEEAESR